MLRTTFWSDIGGMAIAELYRETENVKYVGVRVQCTSSV